MGLRDGIVRQLQSFLRLALVACLFGFWTSVPAAAQTSGVGQAGVVSDAASLQRLVTTLEDAEQRDRLIKDLRALLAAMPAGTAPAGTKPGVIEGDAKPVLGELNRQLAAVAGEHTDRLFSIMGEVGDAVANIADLPAWFQQQVSRPERRRFWLEVATGGIGLPILVALLARWCVGLVLRGAVRRLRDTVPGSVRGRIFTGVMRGVLEAVTVVAVLAAGYAVLALVTRSPESRQVAELLIQAIAVLTGAGVMARLLFAPHAEALRPIPLASGTAAYLYLWAMRLALVGIVGFVASRIAVPLGAAEAGAHAVEILAAIVLAGLSMILVMQSREALALTIRGTAPGPVRRRLADIWHVLAGIYILMVFGVFTSGAQDGFIFLIRATAITVGSVGAAIVASHLFDRLLRRIFELDPELDARFPGLRERSNLYRPVLKRVGDGLLVVVVILAILAGWDVGLIEALSLELRGQIVKSIGTIVFVLFLSVLTWEFASSAISRALSETNPDGTPRETGSRAKTLLPLLRRAILIALTIFGGLIVLAEIGINIAPLLAGAGVLGLAIGFGSQALVRDIITGLFILIEDTIAVGDVVTVGGHSGVVEDLSIRTIKLRDLSGTVHTVPFGDVTTVENFTKDYSFALLDIGVAYREDTDAVCRELEAVAEDLQADADWGPKIMEPIQVLGVNELADSAVIIRSRIKTQPIMQWGVRREFFRRIKKRFDEVGIEMPFPHTTLYFGEDQNGMAPAARIRMTPDDQEVRGDLTDRGAGTRQSEPDR